MATVEEIKSGLISEQTETEDPYKQLNIADVPAVELDRRYFSGATEMGDTLKRYIENADGYRSFETYYDIYKKDSEANKRLALPPEEFKKSIREGKIQFGGQKIDETIDPLKVGPIKPFPAGLDYDAKIRFLVDNRGSEITQGGKKIGELPIKRMLGQYDVTEEDVAARMPVIPYTPTKTLITKEGKREIIEGPQKELFKEEISGKGIPLIDFNNKAVKFKKFLDVKTDLNPYQKIQLVKAQATGNLGSMRTEKALTNVPFALANFALYAYEGIGNTILDPLVNANIVDGKIPSRHVDYATETLTKLSGLKSSDAELILEWTPDALNKIVDAGIEGATVALPFQAIKVGSYFYRDKRFRNFVKDQFGKKGGTFDEAYDNAVKQGRGPDTLIKDFVDSTTFINSTKYKNWKANGVMNSIQRAGEYKRIFKKNPVAYEVSTQRLKALNERLAVLEKRKNLSPEWESQYKQIVKDIDKVNGQLDSISLMNRIPDDLKEIVGTEIAIATGFGLSSYTHQEFFPNSNKTMFELGGMVIGGFSGGKVINLVNDFGDVISDPTTVANKIKKVLTFRSSNQKEADKFIGMLNVASPQFAQRMEQGILAAENLTTKILKLEDQNGRPLITSPDIVTNSLAAISTIDLLKQTAAKVGTKLSVGGVAELSDNFVKMQTALTGQIQLNTELTNAVRELSKIKFAPDTDPDVKSFVDGLESYLKKSQEDVSRQLNNFNKNIDDNEALLLMKTAGAKLDTDIDYDALDEFFIANDTTRETLMRSLGMPENQIIAESNKRIDDMNNAIIDASVKADNISKTLPKEYGNLVSSSFHNIKRGLRSNATRGYKILRQENKNVAMDMSNVFDQLVKGVDDSDLALKLEGSPEARRIGGTQLAKLQQSQMGELFERSAGKMFSNNPKIGEMAELVRDQYPNASNIEIWSVLRNGDPEKGFEGLGDAMKLPLDFVDYQLVLSGLGKVQFKAKGRQTLGVKQAREMLYKAAESEKHGFRIGMFQPDGGQLVNESVLSKLKQVNNTYSEFASRYETGIAGTWNGYKYKTLPDGTIRYVDEANDPMNWMQNSLEKYNLTKPFAKNINEGYISEMAGVYGGNLVRGLPEGSPARYEFVAGKAGTTIFRNSIIAELKFQLLNNTQAGKTILDLNKNPAFKNKYLLPDDIKGKRIIGDYKDNDIHNIISNMQQAKMRNPQTGEMVDMFTDVDIQNIYDSIGIEQLVLKSDDARKAVQQVKKKIKQAETDIIAGKTEAGKDYIAQKNLQIKMANQLNPGDVFNYVQNGETGVRNLDKLRDGYEDSLIKAGKNQTEIDDEMIVYDRFIANKLMEEVANKSTQNILGTTSVGVDMVNSSFTERLPQKLDANTLINALGGAKDTPMNIAVREILKRGTRTKLDKEGSDKFFENMEFIAELLAGRTPSNAGQLSLSGIPRGLSVESYISRIYSVARGVVSLKYLATEAIIQTGRVRRFNSFKAMINNPEIADLVVSAIRTGKPLTGDLATKFDQLMISAIARQSADFADSSQPDQVRRPAVEQEVELFGPDAEALKERKNLVEDMYGNLIKVEDDEQAILGSSGQIIGVRKKTAQELAGPYQTPLQRMQPSFESAREKAFERTGGVRPGSPESFSQIN